MKISQTNHEIDGTLQELLQQPANFPWSPEMLRDIICDQNLEFRGVSPLEAREILMNRYFDCLDYSENGDRSLRDRYPDFCLPQLDWREMKGVDCWKIRTSGLEVPPNCPEHLRVFQFGSTRIYKAAAGACICVDKLGTQDLVASSGYVWCSALVAQEKERFILSHILGSTRTQISRDLAIVYSHIRNSFKIQGTIGLLHPYWNDEQKSEVKEFRETQDNDNAVFDDFLLKHPEVTSSRFACTSALLKINPHNINSTTIIATNHGFRSIGIILSQREKKRDSYKVVPAYPTLVDDIF